MTKKYVNVRRHPSKNYHLKCYNKKAFFDRHWTEETIHARGHVYDDDGNLLSMPFQKFFNIDENDYSRMEDVSNRLYQNFDSIVMIPKYNGHLSILFHDGEEWVNTTKGSFDHEFVELDRLVLEDSGFTNEMLANVSPDLTFCFEIVADYDPHLLTERHKEEFEMKKDFAILLGVNDRSTNKSVNKSVWANSLSCELFIDSGKELIYADSVPLTNVVERFESPEDAENWINDIKTTAFVEGYILHDMEDDWRIKVKTDWFVYERYKFQFNADRTRNIFKKFYDSEAAFAKIPEEFHDRYWSVISDYLLFFEQLKNNMMQSFEKLNEAGILMKEEIYSFINTNPDLTSSHRDVMIAYMNNCGFQGRAFDLFCEVYEGFSLVNKKE